MSFLLQQQQPSGKSSRRTSLNSLASNSSALQRASIAKNFSQSTLRRQEKEIERLTKNNFDLHIRIFQLEEKLHLYNDDENRNDLHPGKQQQKRKENQKMIQLLQEKQKELDDRNKLLVKARNAIFTLQSSLDEKTSTEQPMKFNAELQELEELRTENQLIKNLLERNNALIQDLESSSAKMEAVVEEYEKMLIDAQQQAQENTIARKSLEEQLNECIEKLHINEKIASESVAAFEQVEKNNFDLQSQVDQVEKLNFELQSQFNVAEKHTVYLESQVDQLKKKIQEKCRELESFDLISKEKDLLQNKLQSQVDQLEEHIKEKCQELENFDRISKEKDFLQNQVDLLIHDIQVKSHDVKTLEQATKEREELLQKQIQRDTQHVQTLQAYLLQGARHINAIEKENESQKNLVHELRQSAARKEHECLTHVAEFEKKLKILSERKDLSSETMAKLETEKQQLINQGAKLFDLERQLHEKDNQIQITTKEITSLKKENERLRDFLQIKEQDSRKQNVDMDTIQQNLKQAENQIFSHAREIESLTSDNEAMQAKIKKIEDNHQKEVKTKEQEIEELRLENDSISQKLSELQQSKERLQLRMDDLVHRSEIEKDNHKLQIALLEETLHQKKIEIEKATKRCHDLKEILNEMEIQHKNSKLDKKKMKKELEKSKSQVKRLEKAQKKLEIHPSIAPIGLENSNSHFGAEFCHESSTRNPDNTPQVVKSTLYKKQQDMTQFPVNYRQEMNRETDFVESEVASSEKKFQHQALEIEMNDGPCFFEDSNAFNEAYLHESNQDFTYPNSILFQDMYPADESQDFEGHYNKNDFFHGSSFLLHDNHFPSDEIKDLFSPNVNHSDTEATDSLHSNISFPIEQECIKVLSVVTVPKESAGSSINNDSEKAVLRNHQTTNCKTTVLSNVLERENQIDVEEPLGGHYEKEEKIAPVRCIDEKESAERMETIMSSHSNIDSDSLKENIRIVDNNKSDVSHPEKHILSKNTKRSLKPPRPNTNISGLSLPKGTSTSKKKHESSKRDWRRVVLRQLEETQMLISQTQRNLEVEKTTFLSTISKKGTSACRRRPTTPVTTKIIQNNIAGIQDMKFSSTKVALFRSNSQDSFDGQ